MKYELDLQDARIEGKEEGRSETLLLIIENMKKQGLTPDQTAAVLITENMMKQGLTPEQTAALTGLTVDEVEALRKRIR